MDRKHALKILAFVTVAGALFILPVYPCHVDEREGGWNMPETRKAYISLLPPVLVMANGFQWSEHTPTVDWGIHWKYEADRLFVPLQILVTAAFGLWLWLAPDGGEGAESGRRRRAALGAALAWAAAFFVLAALCYFSAGYVDGLYSVENHQTKDTTAALAWAWCALSAAVAVAFLARAYILVAAEEEGGPSPGEKAA